MAGFPESTDTPTEPEASGVKLSLESRLDVLIILTFHARALVGTLGKLARAPVNALLTTSLIGTAMALPFGLYLVTDGLSVMTEKWDKSAEITVFLEQTSSDEDAGVLARSLETHADVGAVMVRGKRDVLRDFQAITGVKGLFAQFEGENPLPPVVVVSATVQATDPATRPRLQALVRDLEQRKGVALVEFDTQWLLRVQAVLGVMHRAVVVLSVLLGVSLLLVIANVVRVMVEQQRDEIAITRICGATDGFLRRPFVYIGVILGIAGGLVAWFVLAASGEALGGPMESLLALYPGSLGLSGIGLSTGITLVSIGGSIGGASAWIAATRELRHDEI